MSIQKKCKNFTPHHLKSGKGFISLTEAAKTCRYSQEYLSLCARQGRLKAKKNKRNWATKKEWLDKYLQSTSNRKNGSQVEKKSSLSDLSSIAQPPAGGGAKEDTSDTFNIPSNLPIGEMAEIKDKGFAMPACNAVATAGRPARNDSISGRPYFSPNFRFAFAFVIAFVLLFTGTVFHKDVFYDISDFTHRGFAHINETIVSDISQSKEDVKNIVQFVKLSVTKISGDTYQGFMIFADDLFGDFEMPEIAMSMTKAGLLAMTDARRIMTEMPEITLSELLEPEITMTEFHNSRSVLKLFDNAYLQTAQLSAISVDTAESYFSWLGDRASNVPRTVLTAFGNTKDKIAGVFEVKEKLELEERMIAQEISQEIKNEIQEIKSQNEFLTKEIQRIEEQGLPAKKVVIGEFEIRDKATGEIWCTWIENSEWVKQRGTCAALSTEK